MSRIYNFSAGPGVLPLSVLERARDEMVEYPGAGMSVMEMSHRSKEYMAIITKAQALMRELMGISSDYEVLFLQGGASLQFSMVPMNLVADKTGMVVDYILTGSWAKKAKKEADKLLSRVHVAGNTEAENFSRIPRPEELNLSSDAVYVHITSNNTIFGTEYDYIPETGAVPLVADMSSNILSRQVDVSRYGLIYAGAQKNLGPAGVTVVIIRKDLLGRVSNLPAMLDYKIHAADGSMYNTPPTYAIYILGLVLEWVKSEGGVVAIEQKNVRKAEKLYHAIDRLALYRCPTSVESRSRMNIPFTLTNPELDAPFLDGAKKHGLVNLKGHRSVGGMRASLYNAMPEAGVDALIAFMEHFQQEQG